jgi:hypothetical protein
LTIRVNDTTQIHSPCKEQGIRFDSNTSRGAGRVDPIAFVGAHFGPAGSHATQATGSLCDTRRARQQPAEMRRFACRKCTDGWIPRGRAAILIGLGSRHASRGFQLRSAGRHLASPCQCRGASKWLPIFVGLLGQNRSVDALSRSSCPFIRGKICGGLRAGVSRCDCIVETLLHASGNTCFLRQAA